MRVWIVLFLAGAPWAGCLGGLANETTLTMFGLAPIERGDPLPVGGRSCDDLLATLNQRALTNARVALDQSARGAYRDWMIEGDVVAVADSSSAASSPPSARDAQVTGTNNQEAAADEADLVKTDGEWTYVFSGRSLYILHSESVGDAQLHARIEFEQSWGGVLLLDPRSASTKTDDRLILLLSGQSPPAAFKPAGRTSHDPMVRIVVLSLEDRRNPTVEREQWIEGWLNGARLVAGTVYAVVHKHESSLDLQTWAYPTQEQLEDRGLTWNEFHRLSEAGQSRIRRSIALEADEANVERLQTARLTDHLPTILDARAGRTARILPDEAACRRVLTTQDSTGRGITTVFAIGTSRTDLATSTLQVAGASPMVYASEKSLVLSAPSQDLWWFWAQPTLDEATDLQWFDLDGLHVRHRASGRVAGIVQDSFGIDVEGDQLRVATTTGTWGRWWLRDAAPLMNHLAVFEAAAGQLVPKGTVGGIAPGERIWSARFTPARAYIVTFEQIDPLWVIDLTGAPRILGELEIPGVSTYIHPINDRTLLTIGLGPRSDGQGLDWGRMQVSLFDISNPQQPRRADVLDLAPASGHSWSGALHEHKAFTYWDAVGMLAVPITTYRAFGEARSDGARHSEHHVALKLIDVDVSRLDLRIHGEVHQDALVDQANEWRGEIQRSYFLGYPKTGPVSVYAVSGHGVTSHDMATLKDQSAVAFE